MFTLRFPDPFTRGLRPGTVPAHPTGEARPTNTRTRRAGILGGQREGGHSGHACAGRRQVQPPSRRPGRRARARGAQPSRGRSTCTPKPRLRAPASLFPGVKDIGEERLRGVPPTTLGGPVSLAPSCSEAACCVASSGARDRVRLGLAYTRCQPSTGAREPPRPLAIWALLATGRPGVGDPHGQGVACR